MTDRRTFIKNVGLAATAAFAVPSLINGAERIQDNRTTFLTRIGARRSGIKILGI